jgi:hypothetical protein
MVVPICTSCFNNFVFMYFVWLLLQTVIISLSSFNKYMFVSLTACVLSELQTEFLTIFIFCYLKFI